MDTLATPQPLVDVQQGDWIINEHPIQCSTMTPIRHCFKVTKRTPKLIWIGGDRYRLSGAPTGKWAYDRIRLPKPGEVDELRDEQKQKEAGREESAHQYRDRRERYISLIYQAALKRDRELFVELLGPWEVGDWDEKLAQLDEINQTVKG